MVVRFALLQSQCFRFGVEMGRQPAHDFNGADAVGDLHHFLGIEVLFFRPASPLAVTEPVESTRTPSRSKRMAAQSKVFMRFLRTALPRFAVRAR